MSFGWSAGDIAMAIEFFWEVGKALNSTTGSPDDRIRANQFLNTFKLTIDVVQDVYGPHLPGSGTQNEATNVPPPTQAELGTLNGLKELYDKFKDEVAEYEGMNNLSNEKQINFLRRAYQKITWHFFAKKQITDLREKIAAQVLLLQPALTLRQSQGITIQAALHHEEMLANVDDMKNMLRIVLFRLMNNNPSANMPQPTSGNLSLSRAPTLLAGDPGDYTGYTTARQQLAPFISPVMPDQISRSLKRLRVTYKLKATVQTWLKNLDSASSSSNILWLIDTPVATQASAILFSVVSSLDRPILSFSCSHVDPKNKAIAPDTLLRNMIYSFLYTLLTYLDTHLPQVSKRVDAPSFNSLASSTTSMDTAITLLGNLLDNLPTSCIVIIDNSQFLDKPAVKPHLREFFNLFGRRPNRTYASFEGSHKLLLTSKGFPGVLANLSSEKRLTQFNTENQVVQSAGYILWEDVKSTVEGMQVAETGVDVVGGETGGRP